MDDDFTGVPTRAWWDLRQRVSSQGWMLVSVTSLLVLLIYTLVTKGVLSWADLLPFGASSE